MASMPGRAPVVVDSAGLRRGDEGLRAAARHPGGAQRSRPGCATSPNGWRRNPVRPAARHRARRWSCRIRATSATSRGPRVRCATVLAPAYRLARDRRRRPVLRCRGRLRGSRARARRRRSATARSARCGRPPVTTPTGWSSSPPTPGARCTSARRASCPPSRRAAGRRPRAQRTGAPRCVTPNTSSNGCSRSRPTCATSPTTACAPLPRTATPTRSPTRRRCSRRERAVERAIVALGGTPEHD